MVNRLQIENESIGANHVMGFSPSFRLWIPIR